MLHYSMLPTTFFYLVESLKKYSEFLKHAIIYLFVRFERNLLTTCYRVSLWKTSSSSSALSYNLIEVFCFSNPNFQTSTQTRNWSKKHFYKQWSFFIRCLFFLSSIQFVFLEWKITNIFLLHSVIVSFIFFMLSNWQLHYTLFRAYFKGSRQGSIGELIRLQQFVSQLGS